MSNRNIKMGFNKIENLIKTKNKKWQNNDKQNKVYTDIWKNLIELANLR